MVLTESNNELQIGDTTPTFTLKGTDEQEHSLESLQGQKATLVVFMCNHCPYVKPKIDELNRITTELKAKGLAVIGINSNESQNYPEDSFERMQELVKNGDIQFPYLHDQSQDVAKAWGAVCTPDPFVIDSNKKLVWHARIDDSPGDKPATTHELYEAIVEFLETGHITKEAKPSMGCSIKWLQ